MELTVAEVSGLIAAGVFILQQLLSLVFPAALVGFVREENTAVTWSVLGRSLQSSPWPTILQTDTAARHGVRRRVSNGLTFQTVTMLLISVAAIVTPLGLYQSVEPGGHEFGLFEFAKDESPFGYATHARLSGPFSRSCGPSRACPGSWVNENCTRQGLANVCTAQYGRSIPEVWRSTFREGARQIKESVSSIFDIQWRNQINASDPLGEWSWYMQSGYRQTGILVLDPTIQLIDGLIVDAKDGGIGFRNHTAPAAPYEYGSTWSEDILFIEPEAQCVDLNLTFDFQLVNAEYWRLQPARLALVDHGGLSELSRTSPDLSLSPHGNGQGPVDLKERAYKAAWTNNFLTLAHFNATDLDPNNITRLDVTPGMRFEADESDINVAKNSANATGTTTFLVDYQSIRSNLQFGEYLNLSSTSAGNRSRVSAEQFYIVSQICGGVAGVSPANINSSLVGCGLVYGAAYRTDGGDELSPQPGSNWSVPVYSCAASVRATIRTVTFRHNGTGLAGLRVTATEPKRYASPAEHPIWAVEDMPREYMIKDTQPLWGLLPDSVPAELERNISTVRQPWLRLPGLVNSVYSSLNTGLEYVFKRQGQNLPGVDFYTLALQNAFSVTPRPYGASADSLYYGDYSGITSLAMYSKWRNLTRSDSGTAHLLRLLWTDMAANSVVGTKGWGLDDPAALGEGEGETGGGQSRLRKRDDDDDDDEDDGKKTGVKVPVTVYRRRVRYDLPYMVPAIVVLVLAVGVLCTWVVLMVMRRTGLAKMRWLLDATSPGRILGGFLWPEKAATLRGTNEWVKTLGTKRVVVGSKGPGAAVVIAAGPEDNPQDGEPRPEGEETIQLVSKDRPAGAPST
ncbi:hypothetical protein VTH82DRAFT_4924 [Thermothelomyces myriococcoides]